MGDFRHAGIDLHDVHAHARKVRLVLDPTGQRVAPSADDEQSHFPICLEHFPSHRAREVGLNLLVRISKPLRIAEIDLGMDQSIEHQPLDRAPSFCPSSTAMLK